MTHGITGAEAGCSASLRLLLAAVVAAAGAPVVSLTGLNSGASGLSKVPFLASTSPASISMSAGCSLALSRAVFAAAAVLGFPSPFLASLAAEAVLAALPLLASAQ